MNHPHLQALALALEKPLHASNLLRHKAVFLLALELQTDSHGVEELPATHAIPEERRGSV